jgi:hypothetical protein
MASGAHLFEVIYTDTEERVAVLVGVGDTIIAQDWAEAEYPYPPRPVLGDITPAEIEFNLAEYRYDKARIEAKREERAGLYACFLGAKRGKLRAADEGWMEWLSLVTMPDDEDDEGDEAEASAVGESAGPPSAA